jgi:hypothetical protein
MGKAILLGLAAGLGIFAFFFLISQFFFGFGSGAMMGGRYSGQNGGSGNCPVINGYNGSSGNNNWGMMGNWR